MPFKVCTGRIRERLAIVALCLLSLSACSRSKDAEADTIVTGQQQPNSGSTTSSGVLAGQIYDEDVTPDLSERASCLKILPGNRISYVTHNGMSDFEASGSYSMDNGNQLRVVFDGATSQAQPLEYRLESGTLVCLQDNGRYLLRTGSK